MGEQRVGAAVVSRPTEPVAVVDVAMYGQVRVRFIGRRVATVEPMDGAPLVFGGHPYLLSARLMRRDRGWEMHGRDGSGPGPYLAWSRADRPGVYPLYEVIPDEVVEAVLGGLGQVLAQDPLLPARVELAAVEREIGEKAALLRCYEVQAARLRREIEDYGLAAAGLLSGGGDDRG